MKGIVNVSIAAIAFKVEDEAFTLLDSYLSQIRGSYADSPDGEEIISDIEARIAEIILAHQEASVVVPRALIESAIQQLGAPEDISEGAEKPASAEAGETPASEVPRRLPHRLYRSSEEAKLGGVCSGLGAYFDVDAVIVRLLFAAPLVLLIFFFILGWGWIVRPMTGLMTTSFILYFLLWIVIPKAKTPLQKLEMRGEKITKDKIERTIREEFSTMNRGHMSAETRIKSDKAASLFTDFLSIIGNILLFCAKAIVAIIGFSFIMVIVGILVALIVVLFQGPNVISGFTATSPSLLVIIWGLAIVIPLGLAVYGILKMLFGFQHNKTFVSTLMVVWILTLVFGTVILIKDFDNIRFGRNRNVEASWDPENARRSSQDPNNDRKNWHISSETLLLAGDTLHVASLDTTASPSENFLLKIRRADNDTPSLELWKCHKGYKEGGETTYIDRIEAEYLLRNDTLFVRPTLAPVSGAEDERVELNIYLPERKAITVGQGINYNQYFKGE